MHCGLNRAASLAASLEMINMAPWWWSAVSMRVAAAFRSRRQGAAVHEVPKRRFVSGGLGSRASLSRTLGGRATGARVHAPAEERHDDR